MLKKHLKIQNEELSDILFVSVFISLMFSIAFLRFSKTEYSFFGSYIIFFIFIFIMYILRQLFLKFLAYHNGFEIKFFMTYFDRFGFEEYHKMSWWTKKYINKSKTGIPTIYLSFLLYILTFGIIIYPGVYRYNLNKIPYKYVGTRQKYETELYFGITNYRYAKVLFGGFLFYFLFAAIIKFLGNTIFPDFHMWFIFTIIFIGFITIIPIIGTEGYEIYNKSRFAWISAIVVMIVGFLTLLVLSNFLIVLIGTIIIFIITMLVYIYRNLVN